MRYRYDKESRTRLTTVELVEEQVEWTAPTDLGNPTAGVPDPNPPLAVRIQYGETDLREKAKSVGAIWRPRQKLWEMRYEDVVALGLESRVAPQGD